MGSNGYTLYNSAPIRGIVCHSIEKVTLFSFSVIKMFP